jgi:hypothetical protein
VLLQDQSQQEQQQDLSVLEQYNLVKQRSHLHLYLLKQRKQKQLMKLLIQMLI